MGKILIIDNFDSFTYNLYQLIGQFYIGDIDVIRNNAITLPEIVSKKYQGIIISPGPKKPEDAGISMEIIKQFYKELPILGICLGMQCINKVFSGITVRSKQPDHGKTAIIEHNSTGLFKNINNEFAVARYHSLIIDNVPDALIVNSWTKTKIPMAIMHRDYPLFGVQFHPESFLTEKGDKLITNFLYYV